MTNDYSAIYCFDIKEYMVYFGDDHVGYFNPDSHGISLYEDGVRFNTLLTEVHLNQLGAIMRLRHEIDSDE